MKPGQMICFLQDTIYDPAGGGVWTGAHLQTYLLAKHFLDAGLEVSFLLPTWLDLPVPSIYDGMTVRRVNIHERVPFLRDWGAVMKELEDLHPDFIYTRGRSWMNALASSYARKHGARSIWASCNEDGCKHWKFSIKAMESNAPLHKKLRRFSAGFLEDLYYAWGIRNADRFVNQTERQCESLMEEFNKQGVVIRSIQDAPLAEPRKDDPPLVIWVGWLDVVKRPELFFQLARDCADLAVDFCMIGGATTGFDLEHHLAIAAVNPRFRYMGRLGRKETLDMMSRATLLVNTSGTGGDGIPNVMIEAWMRRVPAVTCEFDPGGLIQSHGLGIVTADYRELAATFRALITDSARLDELATLCRDTAIEIFSGEKVVARYLHDVLEVEPRRRKPAVVEAVGGNV
jgi:glycosyltransferase involved in cell wall biosynthesis